MGFKVNTLPISLFAGVLGQWEQACREAHDYAKNQLNVSTIETGFLGALFPSHTDAQNLVPKAMSKLPPLMSGCKDGLDGAKQLYDSTEKHEAERLDRTYPSADGPRPNVSIPGVGAMPHLNAITAGDPAGRLNQPHPPKEFEDPNKILNSIDDALSPGYWTSKILEETIGYNPLKEVSKYVAGD